MGIHLHRNKISHATRLELANIETWLHEEGLRAPDNPDPSNVIVKVRADGEGAETKETYHSSPVEALQIRPQTKLKSLTMRPRRRNSTSRNSIWERLAAKKIKSPTKRVPKTAKKPPNSNPYLWLTGFLCYNLLTYSGLFDNYWKIFLLIFHQNTTIFYNVSLYHSSSTDSTV